MATTATRLTNTGTLLVNGVFDEVTFNTSTPTITNLLWQTQNWTANIQSSANVSVTANSVQAPDGTLTASTLTTTVGGYNNDGLIQKWNPTGIATTALPYCLSMYVKQGNCPTVGLNLAFYNGSLYQDAILTLTWSGLTIATSGSNTGTLNYGVINAGAGWYRLWCSATNNYSAVGVVGRVWTRSVYNNNVAGDYNYIWGMQIEQGSSPTVYQGKGASTILTPTWATRTVPSTVYATGQFDEVTYNSTTPTIKNLFKYTETFYFDYVNWTLNSGRMTQNATLAPDGRSLAPKLIEDTVLGNQRIYNWHAVTAGTTYTYSIFLKPAERYIIRCYFEDTQTGGGGRVGQYLNLQTGTIISTYQTGSNTLLGSNLQYIDNGWYRYSWTVQAQQTAALNSTAFVIFSMGLDSATFSWTGDGTSGMYIWGAQKEISTAVTSYQGIGATTLVTPNFARQDTSQGNVFVTGSFDEFTGAPVVDSSLQWWFDGAQTASYSGSGTGIRNLANTAQTGTIYGNVTYSSNAGGQFVFNNYLDTTNYISAGNIGYPTSFNDPWTAETWIFVPTGATWSNGVNKGALYLRGSYAGVHGLMRTTTDNQVGIVVRGNTTAQAERYGTTVRNQWNQVVGVWTGGAGGNLQCYVNGTLTQSGTTTQDNPIELAYWVIGGSNGISGASGSVFEGNISGVKFYTRALSADEVAQNFNALRRRYNI